MIIPISMVDENMKTAQMRDACLKEKFYFRKNIFNKPDETEIYEECAQKITNEYRNKIVTNLEK